MLALAGSLVVVLVAPVRAQEVELKPRAKVKHDQYLITAEEIAEHPELKNGYDVVRRLRNQWLRPSRTGGAAPVPSERVSPYADSDGGGAMAGQFLPVLYIDEIKREGVNDLRALQPADIFELRFLSGNQASGRYGSGHEYGAILVKTVRFGRG